MSDLAFEEDGSPYLAGRVLLVGDAVEVFDPESGRWLAGELFFGSCFDAGRKEYGVAVFIPEDWTFLPLETIDGLHWTTGAAAKHRA